MHLATSTQIKKTGHCQSQEAPGVCTPKTVTARTSWLQWPPGRGVPLLTAHETGVLSTATPGGHSGSFLWLSSTAVWTGHISFTYFTAEGCWLFPVWSITHGGGGGVEHSGTWFWVSLKYDSHWVPLGVDVWFEVATDPSEGPMGELWTPLEMLGFAQDFRECCAAPHPWVPETQTLAPPAFGVCLSLARLGLGLGPPGRSRPPPREGWGAPDRPPAAGTPRGGAPSRRPTLPSSGKPVF